MGFAFLHGVPESGDNKKIDAISLFAKIVIWCVIVMVLVACGTAPTQKITQGLETGVIYKKDMQVCIDSKCRQGVIVGPQRDFYHFKIKAQGNLDLFTFATCHREEATTEHSKRKWFRKNREVKGNYIPRQGIETGYCPVYIGGYDLKGRHSWAFVDFKTPEANLSAELSCNGELLKSDGVSICQSREGLLQSISFKEAVEVDSCGLKGKKKDFVFKMPRGECVAVFFGANDLHRLTLIGYDKIIVRSE